MRFETVEDVYLVLANGVGDVENGAAGYAEPEEVVLERPGGGEVGGAGGCGGCGAGEGEGGGHGCVVAGVGLDDAGRERTWDLGGVRWGVEICGLESDLP